jgi:hypothetical protein
MTSKQNSFAPAPMVQDLGFDIIPMGKLTQAKRFFKSDENNYILFNIYDNKKLILTKSDLDLIDKINMNDLTASEWCLDLDRYLVKFVVEKQFFQIIDKRTYIGVMGLKEETLFNMVKYAEKISER